MRWVYDTSRRFSQRPYYKRDELDLECEKTISSFLIDKYGSVRYPISTSDLTVLIERDVADLDLGVDLSNEGESVDGLTDFIPKSKPKVRISDRLVASYLENRLRTTLAHELGHVKYHSFLFSFEQPVLPIFQQQQHSPRCKRETILFADQVDWMEWQAGYASGAYLMPITHLKRLAHAELASANCEGPVSIGSPLANQLIAKVMKAFRVSEDAARVRLVKCEIVVCEALPVKII